MDLVATLPWPVGVALGIVAYLGVRYGIGLYLQNAGGPMLRSMGEQAANGMFAPLAWMALVMCWIAAAVSFVGGQRRKRLLEVQSGLDSITAMTWQEFEMLVGEAYRRQGYSIEETGLGGADGGVDLILLKSGRKELVQCKQWKSRQVSVSIVREMWGLVNHHAAAGTKIVCVGTFSRDAAAFAAGKPIELVTGEALLSLMRSVQSGGKSSTSMDLSPQDQGAAANPCCPRCGTTMVKRTNKRTGEPFWGCSIYPRCRGALPG